MRTEVFLWDVARPSTVADTKGESGAAEGDRSHVAQMILSVLAQPQLPTLLAEDAESLLTEAFLKEIVTPSTGADSKGVITAVQVADCQAVSTDVEESSRTKNFLGDAVSTVAVIAQPSGVP